ncbi:hypothetical protein [Phytohabitans kaempferiae]|uniref:MalT-like TPR region domain-containing protein n=1 Tax=Phytohabitans kaempferiae TaxID=1620943 RepID=A0ABV6MBD2_9ACTN
MTSDQLLVTRTLANMARQAVHIGRPREAVLLSQRGLDHAKRTVTPRVRALLSIREAQGWAALKQAGPATEAIRRAHDQFERGPDDRDPEWISFLNEAELACLEGMCQSDLGRHSTAERLLKRSIALHTDGYRRNMGIGLIRLASNSLSLHDLDQAGEHAARAATVATEITSTRVRQEITSLGRQLGSHKRVPAVADALERIADISVPQRKGKTLGSGALRRP